MGTTESTKEIIGRLLDAGILPTPEMIAAIERGEGCVEDFLGDALEETPGPTLPQASQSEATTPTTTFITTSITTSTTAPPDSSEFQQQGKSAVKVLQCYNKPSRKRSYEDFVQYFRRRFAALSQILQQRPELYGVTSISRLLTRRSQGEQEKIALIGMVTEKVVTKNKNYILTIEDYSGEINLVFHQNRPEAYAAAQDVVLDEVIGITGTLSKNTVFVDKIFFPDVPTGRELKKSPIEEYAIVIGDPQVGGKEFLKKDFMVMLHWLNGRVGTTEQRAIAQKVRYAIIVGDLVEGVGVYPNQEQDLEIKDIVAQYEEFAKYLEQFPAYVNIILCPGNHDAGRIAEPQPPLYQDFAARLYEMPNVTIISSPGLVNIGATDRFQGFDVLVYHGYSIPWLADNVPSIRNAGGQKAADRVMKFMLQRRHLAPTHGSNLYIPDPDEDPLVITKVPDFFLTGHIHRIATANKWGITMINAGCWTDITEDQVKRGLEPQPARLPVINLRTRKIKVINFFTGGKRGEDVETFAHTARGSAAPPTTPVSPITEVKT